MPARPAGPATGPDLVVPLGIAIDNLSVIMFVMVTFIATLIHIYSMGYMHDDPRYPRFFTYLSLFCFSMLGLVASSNVFMIFIFWELVGVCSYLLIGFWYEEKSNCDAANKAFIVNRVGDVGMLMGLGLLWTSLGTFSFQEINQGLRSTSGKLNECHTRRGAEDVVQLILDPATPRGRERPGHGQAARDSVLDVDAGGPRDLRRLRGQERTVSASRVATGCDGGADAGVGLDPRGDDGGCRRVSGRAVFPGVHGRRAACTSRTPAGSRCSSRRRSRWCRPTTRKSSLIRRSASSDS